MQHAPSDICRSAQLRHASTQVFPTDLHIAPHQKTVQHKVDRTSVVALLSFVTAFCSSNRRKNPCRVQSVTSICYSDDACCL